MPLTAGTRLGSYEVVSPLGAGGMGEVYRARHLKLGRDVAIKVLPSDVASDPERRLRFEREARAASALNHPNIVTIHDIDERDGTHYIAMELVEGQTLRELLVNAPLPLGRLLLLARQIAEGLARAHAAGIVHRDLKPENVMVTDDGRVKILDFGLAKLDAGRGEAVSDVSTIERATRTGVVMGTVPYMSPEQAAGRPVDFRSDQFSFGSILYEMASGRRPFVRATTPQTLAAIMETEPEPLGRFNGALPASLIAIVERCLAKDRAARFESTRGLAAALQTVPETSPSSWIPKAAWALGGLSAVILAAELLPRSDRFWQRLTPGTSAPAIQALAVLPLQNLSGDPEQEYFADGMTDALTTDLAKIGSLKVISRSSAMRYKGTKQPLADIATELGVDAVLEGSAVRDGGRVRITAQLVDPRTRQALWAESYERDFADVLRLQGEVARTVAQRVRARLTAEERDRLASDRAVNPEAYEAYLRGRFYNQKLTREDLDTALRYFELALEKDPQYAPGYAGIASVWGARQQFGWASPREAGPKRTAAVQRAMALDGELPEVRLQLARMKAFTQWDFPGADAEFRRTIDLNPNYVDARVLYSRVLDYMGRTAEAASHIERARQLDPHSAYVRAMYAVHLCHVRRYDEAVAEARSAHAADPALPLGALRIAYVAKGMLKEALEVQADTARREGDSELAQILQRGHDQGSYREAERAAAELLEARSRKGTYVPASEIAVFYDAAGLPDKALEWVEKGIDQRDPNVMGLDLLTSLSGMPGGRGNPRLQEIRRRIGLP